MDIDNKDWQKTTMVAVQARRIIEHHQQELQKCVSTHKARLVELLDAQHNAVLADMRVLSEGQRRQLLAGLQALIDRHKAEIGETLHSQMEATQKAFEHLWQPRSE